MKCRIAISTLLLLSAISLGATEVKVFRSQRQADYLEGTFDGVSLDPLGRLHLADRVDRLTGVEEPFVLSAAIHPEGWVLGTGNAGRVLLVRENGEVRELFAAAEPEVFAVLADGDGTVWAGSSPRGKIYRYRQGVVEVLLEPGEDYIWELARTADGALLAATGTRGRLLRIGPEGQGEVLFDSDDTHLRCLALLADGSILLGTAGEGLVLHLAEDGSIRTLLDDERPEVVDFAVDAEGGVYVALLASESSLIDLAAGEESAAEGKEEGEDGKTATATVTVTSEGVIGSRPARYQGARSRLVRITPSGAVEPVWSFQEETVYALLWHRDRLWVATGLEGKLYSLQGEAMIQEEDVDERQIVALLTDGPGPAFVTTNAAALYRLTSEPRRQGSYTSPVLDTGETARFGSLWWFGEGDGTRFSVRSGLSSEPDRTWAAWTPAVGGSSVPLSAVPPGRYLQWRVELMAAGSSLPRLDAVHVSYRQNNVRPQIRRFEILEPGMILVAAGFNPGNQVFEPASPNREGIFRALGAAADRDEGRTKPLWKKGFRTLQWEAEDSNEDPLRFRLEFRSERPGGEWMKVVEDLEENWYSFDATVLPDGLYRFRLVASDENANLPGEALAAERISEPVVVDHQPPRMEDARRHGNELRVRASDLWNPLREAVISVDAGEWRPVRTADDLLDEREEELILETPQQARLLLLRLTDAAHNVVTFDLSESLR